MTNDHSWSHMQNKKDWLKDNFSSVPFLDPSTQSTAPWIFKGFRICAECPTNAWQTWMDQFHIALLIPLEIKLSFFLRGGG
ncbi:hypothetical protein EUGRSUZ_F04453 [Eucalyptus grandis]|uniref:Uncharacterized protein n=2 Tax=Eucalyptus grandis TaxID=71139 RepID=A0ACC3KQU7_EUCGR|nr:hypothetical protein EUGRSUZ_F04453 [Eucalyptus grandis]